MDVLSISPALNEPMSFYILKPHRIQLRHLRLNPRLRNSSNYTTQFKLSSSSSSSCFCSRIAATSVTTFTPLASSSTENRHWIVIMEKPPLGVDSKQQVIDYFVQTLQRVIGSEKEAQMSIYDASWDTHYGFCCDIDEVTSSQLARLPGVISVKPDPDFCSPEKDYRSSNGHGDNLAKLQTGATLLFPAGNSKHWLVRMDKPGVGVVTKAQVVDFYAQILTKVMGNEKDAQMCIYHVSWKNNFGFCCELDEDCARELAGVPGVLSVQPDNNFESEIKDYAGVNLGNSLNAMNSEASEATPLKTKKLFVTGLSFYTSEKTLRAAFEGFGEIVEVKVIMDKISKRSKGYAFVEYTTEEAAAAALKEMNGKIINGWMIVVDVAKPSPPKFNRGRARPVA
ncbi:hypothetical protein QN277_011302 [Acacia crassicarpa]|uniref:RRM domain-containing protein n=1 Tax=Acacia crassicarpa TaxID=499986 RepID=A0AAE1MYF1_9FABA|nr:hypothetical protein QN277_011302 [Acacia crassicarpa]